MNEAFCRNGIHYDTFQGSYSPLSIPPLQAYNEGSPVREHQDTVIIAGVGRAIIAGAAHRELLDGVLENHTVNGLLLELVKIRKIKLADGETQVTETCRKQRKILEIEREHCALHSQEVRQKQSKQQDTIAVERPCAVLNRGSTWIPL